MKGRIKKNNNLGGFELNDIQVKQQYSHIAIVCSKEGEK
jgi:hypothetical protein